MKSLAYAVVDTIADRVVVYFGAENPADMKRFVRSNFGRNPLNKALDGLNVVLMYDWSKPDGKDYQCPVVQGPVVDFLELLSDKVADQ